MNAHQPYGGTYRYIVYAQVPSGFHGSAGVNPLQSPCRCANALEFHLGLILVYVRETTQLTNIKELYASSKMCNRENISANGLKFSFLMDLSVLYSLYVETHKEHLQDAISDVCLNACSLYVPQIYHHIFNKWSFSFAFALN